ncbi:MAG: glycosyltransferase family 39 protein [Planctomycetota bacterium]
MTFIRKYWLEGLLLFAAGVFLLSGIGGRGLWASEGRWAEVVREMFASGDFFHPTIGGEPYFDKPLLTYWVIAACSAVTGRLDEFIIRLPSVLAALVTLACTMYLGRRLWSSRVGTLAAGLLLTSYGLLMYSNVASAETENLAAVMLAVTWYWARRDRPGFITFLVFYLIMFAGSHMKGLTAFVVPVVVVLPDLLRQRRWRWMLWPSHWLALGIGVCVYLMPFIYATLTQPGGYVQSGLYLVFQENIQRYVQPFDHKGPIYLYLGGVPLLALPWVPILIGTLITLATGWKKLDSNTRWLVQATLMIFAFFTLSGSRRIYYILPILPFCMLLMAVFLAEVREEVVGKHRERGLHIQKVVLVVTAVLEAVLGPVVVWVLISRVGWELPSSLGLSFLVTGLAALLVGAAVYKMSGAVLPNPQLKTIWALILMTGVLQGGFFVWQYNILDSRRTERPFALGMKAAVASLPHERIAFWHKCEDKTLFYMELDPPITLLTDESALREFLESDRPGVIISQDRYVSGAVASMLPSEATCAETIYAWESPGTQQKKLQAWLINRDVTKVDVEIEEANCAN